MKNLNKILKTRSTTNDTTEEKKQTKFKERLWLKTLYKQWRSTIRLNNRRSTKDSLETLKSFKICWKRLIRKLTRIRNFSFKSIWIIQHKSVRPMKILSLSVQILQILIFKNSLMPKLNTKVHYLIS